MKKRGALSTICSVIGTILLIGIIAVYIPMTVPKFMGYEMYTVVSGSMEPEIPTGSLVYVKDADEYEVGDVIAFYGSGMIQGEVVTHRIVDIDNEAREITTKGDANGSNDMLPVPFENVIGTVRTHISGLGRIAEIFSSSQGKMISIAYIAAAVILLFVSGLTDKRK